MTRVRASFSAATLVAVLGLGLGGCPEDAGGTCRLDSDCAAGLVCDLDRVCRAYEAVKASFDVVQDVEVVGCDTGAPADTVAADTSGCAAIAGVFEAGAAPCPAAGTVREVTGLVIQDHDNGLADLASVANQVLANGFGAGDITLALHVDGSFEFGCPHVLAWVRSADDVNADCTPVFSGTMPLDIPNLVSTEVQRATLDPETLVLRGLVDKQALLLALDEALRGVTDQLVTEDTDTDCDGDPDMASAIIQVQLAPLE
ncbi:MAG: hypothetical protein CVU56_08685 [Deltaproteobacteria bacterium HGW-Deltaproteobacteria-14]|jgi:hypothetical protein|nr:MAG: hypothetical protein CVU56_08685 [Deltaproteobacteria bacterium HGW-Deltaproteobacteria-14]